MRILFVSTLYPLNEANSSSVTFALKEFVDEWHTSDEVHVVRPVWNKTRLPAYDFDPQISVVGGIRIPGLERYVLDLSSLIRSLPFAPDIVVAHMFKSYLWAWRIADHFQVPFVAGVHQSDVKFLEFPHFKTLLRGVFSHAEGLACRSPAMRTQLLTRFPEFRGKCFCVNSGIDANIIQPLSTSLEKARRWHTSGEIRFTTAARLNKSKNVDVTLQALSRLPPETRWNLKIVGDGPERPRLEALTKRLKLSDRVSFLGWLARDCVFEELLESDVFILVSAPETFGLVFLEALAAGNVVIGAKGWGIDGFVTDGTSGYLCNPRSAEDLQRKIQRMTSDVRERQVENLIEAAHELVSSSTKSRVAAAYRRHLDEICKSR